MPDMSKPAAWTRRTLRDPVAWANGVQLVKTVVAAVLAWVIAAQLLDLPQHFLAPWSALLVVHATVYRTLSEGALAVTATVIGVVLAWGAGGLLGLDAGSLTAVVLGGLLLGQLPVLRDQGTAIAAAGLIVLTTGHSDDVTTLFVRLGDTGIGIVVGLVVNFVVWPPFQDRSAERAVDAIDDHLGALLREIAATLRGAPDGDGARSWVTRTNELDDEIDHAWGLVGQSRESGRFNPRRGARSVRSAGGFSEQLGLLEQAVAETRSMARTLEHSITKVNEWEPKFKERWLHLLDDAGVAIAAPDHDQVTAVWQGLVELSDDLSTDQLSSLHWPEYGGLIVNLRNIALSMDPDVKANAVTGVAVYLRPRR